VIAVGGVWSALLRSQAQAEPVKVATGA